MSLHEVPLPRIACSWSRTAVDAAAGPLYQLEQVKEAIAADTKPDRVSKVFITG